MAHRRDDERPMAAVGANVRVVASFSGPTDRRSVLDRAHRGDIEGALGRVDSSDTGPRRSMRRRLATLLAVMGPGVIVMVASNDAGGLSVYAQAGQDQGLRLLWLVVLLAPVLFVTQEMVARLGAVSGAGHARLIFERFGRRWGFFALGDLLLFNALTLVTEFIGVALSLGYFGVSRYVSVPVAAVGLVLVTGTGSFRTWERAMYALVGTSLAVVPLAWVSHHRHPLVASLARGASAGPHAGGTLLVMAVVGATVAPWQLFFHQSNVVDKRVTARWLNYERVDTALGTALFALGAVLVLVACAHALGPLNIPFRDAGRAAADLDRTAGPWAGGLFAVVLLNGSVLGAGAVTLATSYAIGDVFGLKHSLHRRRRDAPAFHGSFVLLVALAAAVVLVPGAPLGVVTVGVQALAGILLPSATVFLLLLCNDEEVLGPWVNAPWLNAVATAVVGAMLVLSARLTLVTLFPRFHFGAARTVLLGLVTVALGTAAVTSSLSHRRRGQRRDEPVDRATWTMPPIESLAPPRPSRRRTLGLAVLRAYLSIAAALAVVKVVQLMRGG
jgi:Mn2+/Fe2+ NRAMP family transporter